MNYYVVLVPFRLYASCSIGSEQTTAVERDFNEAFSKT